MSLKSLPLLVVAPGLFVASVATAQSNDAKAASTQDSTAAAAAAAEDTPPTPPEAPPSSAAQESKRLNPPLTLPTREKTPEAPVNPWFVRVPYVISAGPEEAKWKLTIYGFAEADYMEDSTRSFNDGSNSNILAHDGTQAANNARGQFTIRNSRFGFKMNAPLLYEVKPSGTLEFDLFGNQPTLSNAGGTGTASEAAYFNNAGLRVRHAYVKLESGVIDVLMGQMYHLLGWQNYFFGATAAFLGLPNELFNRTTQLRIGHTFESDAMNVEIEVAGFRPVQRDSALPDGEAGLRVAFNHWKGITTPGSGGTGALPAAIGVSGLVRSFAVDPLTKLPASTVNATGWAFAADALIPIIPAKDNTDRGNALTVTGEFTVGTGYADQFTGLTGGATMPANLPIPAGSPAGTMAAAYTSNVDTGLVAYDATGALHTINWRTFVVGLQYYLPPTGRLFVSGNYTQGDSTNIQSLFLNQAKVINQSRYIDGNIFFDVTPSARFGLSYQRTMQTFTDNTNATNDRYEVLGLYFF